MYRKKCFSVDSNYMKMIKYEFIKQALLFKQAMKALNQYYVATILPS